MDSKFSENILNSYTGKRILITGGAGYIAANLVNLLKDINCHIIRFDRQEARLLPINGKAKIDNIFGDIRDQSIWEKILDKTDIVFHFAAQTSTYVSNDNPLDDIKINVLPMVNMLETCRRKNWDPVILFSSTVTVIGMPACLPVDESQTGRPVTVYDLHKSMAEEYLKYYIDQGFVRGAVLRLSNVYGPGPKSSRSDRGILNMMIRKALAKEALTVYGKGDFLRDYIYVEDVARAFLTAGIKIEKVNGRHFIIGTGEGHTIAEAINLVADRVAFKTGHRVDVTHIKPVTPQSPIEDRNFVADSRMFCNMTGWKNMYSLTEGIDSMIMLV
ncbi:MAG: NAD-dependent epimerase/dehydratase family protein [bacterium]